MKLEEFWKDISGKYLNISILLIALFLALSTVEVLRIHMSPDLDNSWMYALQYFFLHGIEHGKDVIFPYGPLGFLFFTLPISTMLYTIAANVVVSIIFAWGSLSLFIKSKLDRKYVWALGFAVVYLLCVYTSVFNKLAFLPLIFILLREVTKQKRYFWGACAIASVALLTKVGIGALGSFAIFSYSLYKIFENVKPADEKQIKITNDAPNLNIIMEILIGAGVFFGTLLLIWLLMYGNITSIVDFIYWTKEVSVGYSVSMNFLPQKKYWLLALFFCSLLIVPFLLKDKDFKLYNIVTFLMLLIFTKYSLVRHTNYIFPFFISYILIFICFLRSVKIKTIIYLVLLFSCIFVFSSTNGKNYNHSSILGFLKSAAYPQGPAVLKELMWDYKENFDLDNELMHVQVGGLKLPEAHRKLIGDKKIDIFPWEQTFVIANDFNWKPKFVFHSNMENTEKLDGRNSLYFQDADAPEFVLWHKVLFDFDGEYQRRGVMSFDRRYMLNENPQSLYHMLNNYEPVVENAFSIILKKTDKKQLPIRKEHPAQNVVVNEWMDVLAFDGQISLLKLFPQRTLYGQIMRILGFDTFSYIDYKFYDDTVLRYKLPLNSTEKHGIWITPHVFSVKYPLIAKKVKQIRITVDNPRNLEKTIPAAWVTMPYSNFKFGFNFDLDNILVNDFYKNKDKLKSNELYYEERKLDENKILKQMLSKDKIKLQKGKKYVLDLELKSKVDGVLYPTNHNCILSMNTSENNTMKNQAILLLVNDEIQHEHLLFIPDKTTYFNNIRMECLKFKKEFDFKSIKLYEL